MRKVAALIALVFVSFAAVVRAQTTNASLTGRITDPQKAIIVDAKVTAINVGTNVRYESSTNKSGDYYVTNLPPGTYRMEVEKAGFKTDIKADVVLHVQDTIEVNFEMTLGSVAESVTVTAGASMINTTDATVSTTIDRNFAENLPLNGRSFQTLILLAPGTVLTSVSGFSNNGTVSVNGQRADANSFTVDGVSANLGGFTYINTTNGQLNGSNPGFTAFGTTQGLVSVDALQEFKIQTSTYAPEFGRQPGGQVSLLTRSGTNDFHGTASDYLRNEFFDANNWFNDQQGLPKGKERQNDFGGTFGGPIVKNKTFFFFSYEGLRLLQPQTEVDTVPSLRLRQEAAPAYQAILNSWPIPDGPEPLVPCDPTSDPACPPSLMEPSGGAPYTFSASAPTNLDSFSIRVDQAVGSRLHVFGRYAGTSSDQTILDNGGTPNQAFYERLVQRALTLGGDIAINPRLSDEVRLNYAVSVSKSHFNLFLIGGAKAFDQSSLFPAPLEMTRDQAEFDLSLPTNSFFNMEAGNPSRNSQRQVNLVDNMSYSVSSHQLKWGIDYQRLFPIFVRAPLFAVYEAFAERDLITSNAANTFSISTAVAHPIFTNFSAYVQDAWRISSRLTLTYGVRWDSNLPPSERDGIYPPNLVGLNSPATATLIPSAQPYKAAYGNFAPRIGVAYQLRQKPGRETVVRGGFGVFYDLNSETFVNGFYSTGSFENTSPIFTNVPFPVANNFFPVPPVPAPLTLPLSFTALGIDPNLKLPYILQWNVSAEQGLGENQSLTASYVASAGYRLLRADNLFNLGPSYPNGVQTLRNASESNYQSLQLQYNRRLSRGVQALASYTYAHSIDNASNAETVLSTTATGSTFPNPNIDRGNSSFDLRHAFRGAITYSIPTWNSNSFSKAVFGGWSLDTIAITQTGTPVDVVGGFYPTADGHFIQLRPNVVPGQPRYLYGAQCAAAHGGNPCPGGMGFNPAAFTPVPTDSNGLPTQVQGTLGRNVMRGFGAWQMDFALRRQFNFTERLNLQFRGEFFNLFNHPNFGSVDRFMGDGTFGQAISTLNNSLGGLNSLYQVGGPRSIQLALKLSF